MDIGNLRTKFEAFNWLVIEMEGNKIEGKINTATADEIVLTPYKKRNPKNKALKPQLSEQLVTVSMNNIKQTKKLTIF